VTDVLDTARRSIEDRLSELRDEVTRLEGALSAITGGKRRGRGRPRRAAGGRAGAGRSANGRRRGRRASGGTRSAQAFKLVQSNPGITIGELAKKMGITPNYLYRVMPALEKEGKVRKRDKGWHPA
jgi:hypothetical protein